MNGKCKYDLGVMLIVLDGNCNKEEYFKKLDIFKSEMNSELPGVLCWALEGLNLLMENGEFSYELNSDENQKIWESEQIGGESFNRFFEESRKKNKYLFIN